MDAPTPSELRRWSQLDFEELGFGEDPESVPQQSRLAAQTRIPGENPALESAEGFAADGEALLVAGGTWAIVRYTGISGDELSGITLIDTSAIVGDQIFPEGSKVQQYQEDKLLEKWRTAISELEFVTGRKFAGVTEEEVGNRMREALRMVLEYKVVAFSQDTIETAADFDMIQNFSAGSYSESRRPDNRRSLVLHPWPNLNRMLWNLITPEKLGEMGLDDAPSVSEIEDPASWDVGRNIMHIPYPRQQFPFPNQYGGWN